MQPVLGLLDDTARAELFQMFGPPSGARHAHWKLQFWKRSILRGNREDLRSAEGELGRLVNFLNGRSGWFPRGWTVESATQGLTKQYAIIRTEWQNLDFAHKCCNFLREQRRELRTPGDDSASSVASTVGYDGAEQPLSELRSLSEFLAGEKGRENGRRSQEAEKEAVSAPGGDQDATGGETQEALRPAPEPTRKRRRRSWDVESNASSDEEDLVWVGSPPRSPRPTAAEEGGDQDASSF